MLKRYILFLKKYPLVTATIAIVYAVICIKTIDTDSYFQAAVLRSLLCGAMAFFLYQISGDKTLASSYNSTWYVIKVGMGYWVLALAFGILGLFASIATKTPVWDNIPLQMSSLFLMFVFVGLFEEMAFRGVINDAMIYAFRDKKHVFVMIAAVSSLVFGAVHIIGADLSNGWAIGQAIGKTLQAGIFGLSMLFLYWKTRNIWACGIVHGMFDFFTAISSGIFNSEKKIGPLYVMSGDAGKAALAVYVGMIVIELFIFWIIYKKIGKKIDYQDIRENW